MVPKHFNFGVVIGAGEGGSHFLQWTKTLRAKAQVFVKQAAKESPYVTQNRDLVPFLFKFGVSKVLSLLLVNGPKPAAV